MPDPPIQINTVAVGLTGGSVTDVGVKGMPVIGDLPRAI